MEEKGKTSIQLLRIILCRAKETILKRPILLYSWLLESENYILWLLLLTVDQPIGSLSKRLTRLS